MPTKAKSPAAAKSGPAKKDEQHGRKRAAEGVLGNSGSSKLSPSKPAKDDKGHEAQGRKRAKQVSTGEDAPSGSVQR
jgi:hypothetical protein